MDGRAPARATVLAVDAVRAATRQPLGGPPSVGIISRPAGARGTGRAPRSLAGAPSLYPNPMSASRARAPPAGRVLAPHGAGEATLRCRVRRALRTIRNTSVEEVLDAPGRSPSHDASRPHLGRTGVPAPRPFAAPPSRPPSGAPVSAPSTTSRPTPPPAARSLVALLGATRERIVEHLRRVGDASVAELAELLEISEVATRRHLGVLEDDGLVDARTVNQGRGRPAARYALTPAASRLFPSAYDQLAQDVLEFLDATQGRDGVRAFLRWRLERQVASLGDAVTAGELEDRLGQLAEALSAAGFSASVTADGTGFTLTQDHCAIAEVAKDHPELCAYEAATFAEVLGTDVRLSRRETLADGSGACVCCVTPRARPDLPPPDDLPVPRGSLLPLVGAPDPHVPPHDSPREDAP
ncbi:ArsR family transcriptional regulator [Nitriliruptoraceae bacterium ZYF776]|nr:ArsR family transcriptional regulator [Profundirhabdus halotolerans]